MSSASRSASRSVVGHIRNRAALGVGLLTALAVAPAPARAQAAPTPHSDTIPGTLVTFDMVAVPGGTVTIPGPDGPRTVTVQPFLIGRTELTWDAYDAFALAPVDASERSSGAGSPDAVARPTRPYGAPDYGYGHAGYPVISIARGGAEAFCAWLSARTGKRYRLPTEAEWALAAQHATGGRPMSEARRDALAWHAGNAGGTTHPVGSRAADALGLHDLFGNAAEWVMNEHGRPVVRGGSFRDAAAAVGPDARMEQARSWNERDPQIPQSRWWLSDAPFVGVRIVREP